MYFDRFDICEAYWCYSNDYHEGMFSELYKISGRLIGIDFNPNPNLCYELLSDNGKDIYNNLVERKHLSGL